MRAGLTCVRMQSRAKDPGGGGGSSGGGGGSSSSSSSNDAIKMEDNRGGLVRNIRHLIMIDSAYYSCNN
jgi:hypothetical protein